MNWKKALPLIVIVLVALWVVMLYRDLKLVPSERGKEETPDVTLENIEVQREISGDFWTLQAERAERFGNKTNLEVIKVKSATKEGPLWFMDAPRGTVTDDGNLAELWEVEGHAEKFTPAFKWSGRHALWDQKGKRWLFPEGLTIQGEDFLAKGARGAVDMSGKITLEDGAYARWETQ